MKRTSLLMTAVMVFTMCGWMACSSESQQQNEQSTPATAGETEQQKGTAAESSTAASPADTQSATAAKPPAPATPEATAASWMGSYTGMYPCSDCPGIDTRLKLNADYTYIFVQTKRGHGDQPSFADKGHFTWDSKGLLLTLNSMKGDKGTPPMQFTYSEKKLTQLDPDGKPYTGKDAGRYILTK